MKRALVLMVITGLNIVALFVFQWYVLVKLGAGVETDALFASMVVPQLILNVVSGSLAYVLVPMLATARGEDFRSGVSSFISALGVLFALLALLLFLTSHLWVPLTVPGFSASGKALTESLSRIQLVGMFFTGVGAVPTAAYQAQHRFVYPALAGALGSVAALAFMILALPHGGVEAAAWGLSLRATLQFALQLPVIFPFCKPRWTDQTFRQGLAKLRPLILGTTYYKTDQLVDRLLVSMAPAGVLSLLHLAQQMYSAANQVLVTAIAAPAVPRLANDAREVAWDAFRSRMLRILGLLLLLGLAVWLLIIFPGHYVLDLMFGHGKLRPDEVRQLWLILIALGGFWITGLSGQILSTSFFAMSDTETPTKIGAVGFTLGIGLKIGGFLLFGVFGVAAATGLYMAFNSIAMYYILNKRLGVEQRAAALESLR